MKLFTKMSGKDFLLGTSLSNIGLSVADAATNRPFVSKEHVKTFLAGFIVLFMFEVFRFFAEKKILISENFRFFTNFFAFALLTLTIQLSIGSAFGVFTFVISLASSGAAAFFVLPFYRTFVMVFDWFIGTILGIGTILLATPFLFGLTILFLGGGSKGIVNTGTFSTAVLGTEAPENVLIVLLLAPIFSCAIACIAQSLVAKKTE